MLLSFFVFFPFSLRFLKKKKKRYFYTLKLHFLFVEFSLEFKISFLVF